MKRCLLPLATMLVAAGALQAQELDKQVVVTRPYTPTLTDPDKLSISPRMDDTVTLRPEIDYTVTPRSSETRFEVRRIAPATTTVWQERTSPPFYLKAGAGAPFNTLGDLRLSWQEQGSWRAGLHADHRGHWGDMRDRWGLKHDVQRTESRAGVYGGVNIGPRYEVGIEAAFSDRRYDLFYDMPYLAAGDPIVHGGPNIYKVLFSDIPRGRNRFNEWSSRLWLGSDFTDLSFTNVRLEAGVEYFRGKLDDHSFYFRESEVVKPAQTRIDASLRVGRGFGLHAFEAGAGVELYRSSHLNEYRSTRYAATLRYRYLGERLRLELGADFIHDMTHGAGRSIDGEVSYDPDLLAGERKGPSHLFPYLDLSYTGSGGGLVPFVHIDGKLLSNDLASISRIDPYLKFGSEGYNGTLYRFRAGVRGTNAASTFSYRLFAGFEMATNYAYWCNYEYLWTKPVYDDCKRLGFGGEATLRPVQGLEIEASARGWVNSLGKTPSIVWKKHIYSEIPTDGVEVPLEGLGKGNGLPPFEASLRAVYDHRSRFRIGVGLDVTGARKGCSYCDDTSVYTLFGEVWGKLVRTPVYYEKLPASIDLSVMAEVRVVRSVWLFAEGHNLLDRVNYEFMFVPSRPVSFTLGAKVAF